MQRKEKMRDNIGIHITTAFPLLKKIYNFHQKFPIIFVLWVYFIRTLYIEFNNK